MNEDHIKNIEKHSRLHLGKADLHIHSNYSDAKPSIEEILEYVQHKTDLDVIAITDHDTLEGALLAQELVKGKKYRFEVVVGEEVSTKRGHIIGLYLKKLIPANLSIHETIERIQKEGGVVIAPHAFHHTRLNNGKNITMDGIGVINLIKEKDNLEGVEIINATPTLGGENLKASFINNTLILQAEIGSSDAHILDAIGKGYTVFEGRTAKDVKEAIIKNQTKALNGSWNFLALAKYLFFFIPRGLRLFWNTVSHGRIEKSPQIINIPKKFKWLNKDLFE